MNKNSFYNLTGGVIRLSLGIVSTPLLLFLLDAKVYGLYVIIVSIINFVLITEAILPIIFTVFLSDSETAEDRKTESDTKHKILNVCFWMILIMSVVLLLFMYIISPVLADFFDHFSNKEKLLFTSGLRFSSLIVVIRIAQQLFIGLQQAGGYFKLYNIINSIFSIVNTICTLFVAYYTRNILFILYSQLIVAVLFTGVYIWTCYQKKIINTWPTWTLPDRKIVNNMIKYAGRSGLGLLGSVMFSQGDKIIVGKLLGLEIAGFYTVVTTLINQINVVSALPVQPIISEISRVKSQVESGQLTDFRSKSHLCKIIGEASKINALIAFSFGCVILIFSPEISDILFRKNQLQTQHLVLSIRIATVIYTLYSLNAVGYYSLYATHNEMDNTAIIILAGILSLSLISWLGFEYGLIGALVGNAGYLVTLWLPYRALHHMDIPVRVVIDKWYAPFSLLTISILTCYFVDDIRIRTFVTVFLTCCFIYLYLKRKFYLQEYL